MATVTLKQTNTRLYFVSKQIGKVKSVQGNGDFINIISSLRQLYCSRLDSRLVGIVSVECDSSVVNYFPLSDNTVSAELYTDFWRSCNLVPATKRHAAYTCALQPLERLPVLGALRL